MFVETMGVTFNKTWFAFDFGFFFCFIFFKFVSVHSHVDNTGEFFCGFSCKLLDRGENP